MALTKLPAFTILPTDNFTFGSANVTGNVSAANIKSDNLLYANGVAWSFGSTYSNSNVTAYLPTYTGDLIPGNITITANGNITLSGSLSQLTGANLVSASYVTGTLTTAAQPNITSVGTLTTLTSGTHTISANSNITMSGSLSQISGANLISGTYLTGTLTTSAQPNITSVGTLTSLTVTGNTTSGNVKTDNLLYANGVAWSFGSTYSNSNVTAYLPTYTGNLIPGNITITANGNITMSGSLSQLSGANLISGTYLTGTLTTAAQPNITSVGTLTSLTTGNITVSANGNITMSGSLSQISGANLISGTYLTGTLTTAAQPNITSLGTLTSLTASGNITTSGATSYFIGNLNTPMYTGTTNVAIVSAGMASSDYFRILVGGTASDGGFVEFATADNGTEPIYFRQYTGAGAFTTISRTLTLLDAAGNTSMPGNLSVTSNISGGNVSGTYLTGTLTTAAQPNITSTGTLSSLTVSGLITATGTGIKVANVQDSTGTVTLTTRYNSVSGDVGIYGNLTAGTNGTGNVNATYFNGNGYYLTGIAAGGGSIIDDTTTNATYYPVYATATSGSFSTAGITTTKLQFNPSSGQLTVQDLNTLSDATLKEEAHVIDDPLTVINQLFGMGFKWSDSKRKSYGLMAQMLEDVLPELVSTNAQGKKTVNYIPIIAFLIEAVKKQQTDIEALKKR